MSVWRVYGRTEYAEPLTERGMISASSRELALELVGDRYGDGWVELVLVPEDGIQWIIGPSVAAEVPS